MTEIAAPFAPSLSKATTVARAKANVFADKAPPPWQYAGCSNVITGMK